MLRIGVNLTVYNPNTPTAMSAGAGWCWGNVAVMSLLFLAGMFGVKRVTSIFRLQSVVIVAVLVAGTVFNTWIILSPNKLGFSSAVWLADVYFRPSSPVFHSRRVSIDKVRNLLKVDRLEGLLLVSPQLMVEFSDRDIAVPQFALHVAPRLLSQAQAAVLLRTDTASRQVVESDASFWVCFEDENLVVFEKLTASEKVTWK